MKLLPLRTSLFAQPAAWLPLLMSLAAISLVLIYVALYFPVHEPSGDEGGFAHTFQLLLLLQLPIVAWFAIKWLPRQLSQALLVMGLQAFAWLGAVGLIYWLEM